MDGDEGVEDGRRAGDDDADAGLEERGEVPGEDHGEVRCWLDEDDEEDDDDDDEDELDCSDEKGLVLVGPCPLVVDLAWLWDDLVFLLLVTVVYFCV